MLTVGTRAEPVRFDSEGKPLNNAAQRQVQRERSERERKRSTIWIAVSLVVAAAVFGLAGALWVWRRRRSGAGPGSESGYSYHNPAAAPRLGERYFSTQYSGSDYSVPATGTGKGGTSHKGGAAAPSAPPGVAHSRTASGGKSPIVVYDNSYLSPHGNEVRSSFLAYLLAPEMLCCACHR